MKIIFAQGNPGREYENTRHNVGFLAIDEFANRHNVAFQYKDKFKAEIAELTYDNQKILLVKPTTFYNETGISARSLVDFYKVEPSDVLVIHDELALPFGTIRIRGKGSDAGNNGIKSLNAHIGQEYVRVRIGIANDISERAEAMNFVLARFSAEDHTVLKDRIFPKIAEIIPSFCLGTIDFTSYVTSQSISDTDS